MRPRNLPIDKARGKTLKTTAVTKNNTRIPIRDQPVDRFLPARALQDKEMPHQLGKFWYRWDLHTLVFVGKPKISLAIHPLPTRKIRERHGIVAELDGLLTQRR